MAAGFAPLALGTETIGSIITPASRAALYATKPTVGVQGTHGVFCISEFFDSPGAMGKSTGDLAALMDVFLPGRGLYDDCIGVSESKKGDGGRWSGFGNVAFVDPRIWKTEGDTVVRHKEGTQEQMVGWARSSGWLDRRSLANKDHLQVEDYEAMVARLREDGCPLKYPIELEDTTELTVDGEQAIMPIACEFHALLPIRFGA